MIVTNFITIMNVLYSLQEFQLFLSLVCFSTLHMYSLVCKYIERDGSVDPSSIVDIHRTIGTTVAVVKIFDALPVRRADFIKRIKAQRAKLLRILQSCKPLADFFKSMVELLF